MIVGKQAEPFSIAVVILLFPYKDTVHTITSDNGTEFAIHEFISRKLNVDFYFAHPYSSWLRELNKYINAPIRQYIAKESDFYRYDDDFYQTYTE